MEDGSVEGTYKKYTRSCSIWNFVDQLRRLKKRNIGKSEQYKKISIPTPQGAFLKKN